MEPASAEKLLKAFQILDSEGKGTISKEYITKLMTEEGEPFTQASKHINYSLTAPQCMIINAINYCLKMK